MNLGIAITLARENLGWSKKELAAKASLSASAVTRIEKGKQGIPLRTAQSIASALGLKMWQLVIVAESINESIDEIKTLQKKLVLALQPYFALVQKDVLKALETSSPKTLARVAHKPKIVRKATDTTSRRTRKRS